MDEDEEMAELRAQDPRLVDFHGQTAPSQQLALAARRSIASQAPFANCDY